MEDSKSRARHNSNHHNTHAKDRQQQLVALFVVGLCAGIIISERLYIRSSRAALQSNGQAVTIPGAPHKQQQLGYKLMRGGRNSAAKAAASSASTVSRAAVAGALAAEVAAAEAAAVAAMSEQLVRTDPQLRELEAYLRKVRMQLPLQSGVTLGNQKLESRHGPFLNQTNQTRQATCA